MSAIQLIVGLANPGKEYEKTRHNAGAWLVEAIAQQTRTTLRLESKFHGLQGIVHAFDHTLYLLIPTTYMNDSGLAVKACAKYHKIPSNAILVVHDDIDLPVGTIKLKFDGGDGGHNGLKDIIQHLATKQFHRLRIGVGHPGQSKDVVNYVLKPPSKTDRHLIDEAIVDAQQTLPLLIKGEMQKAMHQLHTKDK